MDARFDLSAIVPSDTWARASPISWRFLGHWHTVKGIETRVRFVF